jgi:hypothetical protein
MQPYRPVTVIPGVGLPSGAVLVYHGKQDIGGRDVRGIGLNCPGGWPAVRAHFDQQFAQQGYQEKSNLMPDGASADAVTTFPSVSYSKSGGDYLVKLDDTVQLNQQAHLPAPDTAKYGQFMLTIVPIARYPWLATPLGGTWPPGNEACAAAGGSHAAGCSLCEKPAPALPPATKLAGCAPDSSRG